MDCTFSNIMLYFSSLKQRDRVILCCVGDSFNTVRCLTFWLRETRSLLMGLFD